MEFSVSFDEFIFSGWFGRYLSNNHSSYPEGYPNNEYPDPLALTIGRTASNTCQGPIVNMGMSIKNLNSFVDIKEGEGEVLTRLTVMSCNTLERLQN